MVFVRELVSLFQLTVFPGLLLYGLLRPDLGAGRAALLVPGLSLVVNYAAVSLMLAGGFFNGTASWIYFCLTILLLLWVWRKELSASLQTRPLERFSEGGRNLFRDLCEWSGSLSPGGRLLLAASLAGAVLGLCWYLRWLLDAVDNIFMLWDAALSWNRWAGEWAENIFPTRSFEYPQMIPMNWAMAYMLIGEKLQFVPKFAISLFPLLTLLLFLQRGLAKRDLSMLAAVGILAFFFRNVEYERFGADLDLLIAFYSAASFFCILYACESGTRAEMVRRLLTASFLLCASAVTKQAGLYLVAVMPLAGAFLLPEAFRRLGCSGFFRWKILLIHLLLALVIVSPYYLLVQQRIRDGRSRSNIRFVTERIYGERTHFDRFLISGRLFLLKMEAGVKGIESARWAEFHKEKGYPRALAELYSHHLPLGLLLLCLTAWLLFYAMKNPVQRIALLFIGIPYFLIWSVFYCYDLRNLSLAIPFLALAAGGGAAGILGKEESSARAGRICRIPLWGLLLFALLLLYLLHPENIYDHHRRKLHFSKELEIGVPALNKKLITYHEKHPEMKKIATDYEYFNLIPGMKGLLHYEEFSTRNDLEWESYCSLFHNPEVGFLLMPSYTMGQIQEDVAARERSGSLRILFQEDIYTFIEILKYDGDNP